MSNKILKALKDPRHAMARIVETKLSRRLSDEKYLKLMYLVTFGKKLNLKNPQTFNEKLSWLKLYGRKDIYTTMADKYAVKQHVANLIGGGMLLII